MSNISIIDLIYRSKQVEKLQGFFGESQVPETFVKKIMSEHNRINASNIILETLKSHGRGLFAKALFDNFSTDLVIKPEDSFEGNELSPKKEAFAVYVSSPGLFDKFKEGFKGKKNPEYDKLIKLAKDYGYTVTVVIESDNVVIFDVNIPEKINFDSGYAYHVFSVKRYPYASAGDPVQNTLDSIRINGLRTREGENYRKFSRRLFLFVYSGLSTNEALSKIMQDSEPLDIDWKKNGCVVKVKLPKNIDLYRDTTMPTDSAFFTFENIPANYIKGVYYFGNEPLT